MKPLDDVAGGVDAASELGSHHLRASGTAPLHHTTLNFEGFSLAAALLIAFNRIRRASVFTARASLVALIFDDGPTGWSRMAEAMSAVRKVQGTIF